MASPGKTSVEDLTRFIMSGLIRGVGFEDRVDAVKELSRRAKIQEKKENLARA